MALVGRSWSKRQQSDGEAMDEQGTEGAGEERGMVAARLAGDGVRVLEGRISVAAARGFGLGRLL
jgi:hypothetical protein